MGQRSGNHLHQITLSQVASIDFSSYQAIIVGNDMGDDSSHVWLGSAAAEAKIQHSDKPVLGIGNGGTELFDDLGLDIGWPAFATDNISGNVDINTINNAAWNFPNDLPKSTPFAVYSSGRVHPSQPLSPITPAPRISAAMT